MSLAFCLDQNLEVVNSSLQSKRRGGADVASQKYVQRGLEEMVQHVRDQEEELSFEINYSRNNIQLKDITQRYLTDGTNVEIHSFQSWLFQFDMLYGIPRCSAFVISDLKPRYELHMIKAMAHDWHIPIYDHKRITFSPGKHHGSFSTL